jgi:hypothetical protein
MNERIKKLLNQAGIYQPDRFDAIDGSNQMEKFAELIVRECARIVDEPYDFKTPANQRTYRYPLSGETVLEHFGVDE